ncbi:hypothetical protein [Marinobacterium aestuariivivens]|uniref:Uncharacterized protein n=1 Tax=Marinobacterium aestuariivivens TaxID=1698799 RepID=A0ABW2AA30_9GAMM
MNCANRSSVLATTPRQTEKARVLPSLEDWNYVVETKKRWRVLPDSMEVMEFYGDGDPFFGGRACDLVLSKDGRLVDQPTIRTGEAAVFMTIEEAHEAAKGIPNRRPGSILGVLPVWERSRPRTVAERYPRLLKALRAHCQLTELEALCALAGQEPEAIRHLGGWHKAIQAAWESRHR